MYCIGVEVGINLFCFTSFLHLGHSVSSSNTPSWRQAMWNSSLASSLVSVRSNIFEPNGHLYNFPSPIRVKSRLCSRAFEDQYKTFFECGNTILYPPKSPVEWLGLVHKRWARTWGRRNPNSIFESTSILFPITSLDPCLFFSKDTSRLYNSA